MPGETTGASQCLLKAAFATRVRDFCSSKLPVGLKGWQEMVAVISKLFYYPHLGIQEKGSCDLLVKEPSGLMLRIIQLCPGDRNIYLVIPLIKFICWCHKKL